MKRINNVHSEKTKRKMREAHLGKKYKSMSEIGRINISLAKKGRKLSEEIKRKLRGKIPWNKGKKLSEKHRNNLSKALRGKTGEQGHNWRGGITPINQKIRNSIEIRLWREAVFARDNWTCQKCGDNKGGNLNAHHIKSFSKYSELRTAISNGITLCKDCHEKLHNKR